LDVVKQLSPEADAPPGRRVLPMILRVVRGPHALRRWAVVSLIMNILIVVTGGLVRLTGSGLGCPTWPRCTQDSYVSHPQLGIHGAIEFGNRLFTLVLVVPCSTGRMASRGRTCAGSPVLWHWGFRCRGSSAGSLC
jgi:heme A synthase